VYLNAKSGADGQVVDGTSNVFIGRHAAMAVGTIHSFSPITVQVYLDNFR
jgi:hypothetical protein